MGQDWVGRWFEIAEELGEHPVFTLGIEDQWYPIRHTEHDGIGGILVTLRKLGIQPDTIPQQSRPLPAWYKRWLALARLLAKPLPRESARLPSTTFTDRKPVASSWQVVDAPQHRLNSRLLAALDHALRNEYQEGHRKSLWIVPVNMRGLIALSDPTSNATSSVFVRLGRDDGTEAVHGQVKRQLANGTHWAGWYLTTLTRWLSRKRMRRLAQRSPQATGTFTNLGSWNVPRVPGPVVLLPQSFLAYPLSAAAITWNGRTCLSLQAHPSVTRESKDTDRWLGNWVTALRAQTP